MVKLAYFQRDIKMGINDIPQIEIFGRWQTEEYIPPPAVDVSNIII